MAILNNEVVPRVKKVRRSINFTEANLKFLESMDNHNNRSKSVNILLDKIRTKLDKYSRDHGRDLTVNEALEILGE